MSPQIIIIVSIMDLRKRKVVLQIPAEKQMCKQNEHDRFYPIWATWCSPQF